MLEELFKKESFNEEDLKVIHANLQHLTHDQKVRLGFEQPTIIQTAEIPEEVVKKTTTRRKKVV